jgi:uroporphyrinogen-III synthase
MNKMGMVYLVGAGPGDADLLTLRGAELLRRADVVVYDPLVNPELLRFAPPAAERICAGKQAGVGALSREQLNTLMIAKARKGKCVVRLTSGDHSDLSHGGAEAEGLAAAKIPFEIVPGVSCAVAGSKSREKLNRFENRPLFGQRVVVTRAREQAGRLAETLAELGAEVLEIPTIKIAPPTRKQEIVDALLELNAYDWLGFTSPNGVTAFFDYFFKQFHDLRDLGGARIAAVGPATAAKLRELHLQVDLMPEESLAVEIAKAFAKFESIENLKICLLRAEVANPDLPRTLEALGAIVDDIACYRTVAETEDPAGGGAKLLETGADWILFTSGSTVEHFHARFNLPQLVKAFPKIKLATIGPETTKALVALGLKPAVEAKEHTVDGLIAALLKAAHSSQGPTK